MQHTLEAVILDWAGTVVDFGSFAPTQIFVDAFKAAYDFDLTLAEARRPMGLGKWQHIEALGRDPEIAARWQSRFGIAMRREDVEHLYQTFIPLQVERVGQHGELIPGALDAVQALRARGLKIGSTTGYPRAVMQRLMEVAAAQGYVPDCTVCADDLRAGARPGPWMALANVLELGLGSVAHCVKADDTLPGLLEGRNAGMWTVGLALSGSPCGWTLDEYLAASEAERELARRRVAAEFAPARPHYVIDTIAALPAVAEDIERRLAAGERP